MPMAEMMESLEKKREQLYRQLQEIGDFRRSIISGRHHDQG